MLINGQLYPIVQTSNGTHLLIQQPVGQVQQQSGKQIYTAQPIQLGGAQQQQQPLQQQPLQHSLNLQQVSSAPGQSVQYMVPVTTAQQIRTTQPAVGLQSLGTYSEAPATSHVNGLHPATHPATSASFSSSGVAPVLPIATSQVLPSAAGQSQSTGAPGVSTVGRPRKPQPQSNMLGTIPVAVSPQTQQLLTRIQHQIDAFKRMPSLDRESKKTLAQLQQAQQHVLNNVRSQLQMQQSGARGPANSPQFLRPTNAGTAGQQLPTANFTQSEQLLQQGAIQPNLGNRTLIVKPG